MSAGNKYESGKRVKEIRLEHVRASVWERREKATGEVSHHVHLYKIIKIGDKWHPSHTFSVDELELAKKCAEQARQWVMKQGISWPIGTIKGVSNDRIRVEVVRSYDTKAEARLNAPSTSKFIPWHKPVWPPPQKGEVLEAKYGENERLDLAVDQARWRRETQGVHTTLGRWASDRAPVEGEPITIKPMYDYQGKPKDHYIMPLGQRDPVLTGRPVYAVVTLDETNPLHGSLAKDSHDRTNAVAFRQGLERSEQERLTAVQTNLNRPTPEDGTAILKQLRERLEQRLLERKRDGHSR
jgi:hypothetical protein